LVGSQREQVVHQGVRHRQERRVARVQGEHLVAGARRVVPAPDYAVYAKTRPTPVKIRAFVEPLTDSTSLRRL
jgi:hypothetical protein